MALIAAATNALNGYTQRPTGRWSFVLGPLFDAFGSTGITVAWLALAVVFLAGAWFSSKS